MWLATCDILDAVPQIHIVSNHVATDKLTAQKLRNVYKLNWLGWASLSSQSHYSSTSVTDRAIRTGQNLI